MDEPVINEDEMIGYILRKTGGLQYDDVRAVLDAEMEFMIKKGLAKTETTEFGDVDGRKIEYFHER